MALRCVSIAKATKRGKGGRRVLKKDYRYARKACPVYTGTKTGRRRKRRKSR